jgi:hypothetical protein
MLCPREPAAVDDGATERRAMPAHEFRQRVNDDVRTVFDWSQQDRRSDRIIDDQGHPLFVGDLCQFFNVTDIARRIADALAENSSRMLIDQPRYIVRLSAMSEFDLDPKAW